MAVSLRFLLRQQFYLDLTSPLKDRQRAALKAFLFSWVALARVLLNITVCCPGKVSPLTQIGSLMTTSSAGSADIWLVHFERGRQKVCPTNFCDCFFFKPNLLYGLLPRFVCAINLTNLENIPSSVSGLDHLSAAFTIFVVNIFHYFTQIDIPHDYVQVKGSARFTPEKNKYGVATELESSVGLSFHWHT